MSIPYLTPDEKRKKFYKLWLKLFVIFAAVLLFIVWLCYATLVTAGSGAADVRTTLAISELAVGGSFLFAAFASLIEVYD